jgi:hypothetical protein
VECGSYCKVLIGLCLAGDTRLALQLAVDDERTVFLDAIEESLRPLMRAVFAYGVSYQDLVEVVRSLYIFALRDRYEQQGRPTNETRLGLMSGITRGEVVKLFSFRQERAEQRALAAKRIDQLSQLLGKWHDEPQFSTPYGAPLDLSLQPEGTFRTFDQLIEVAGIDMDRDTILSYLASARCIEIHGTRFVRCVSRTLISASADTARIARVGHTAAALNSTLMRNLFTGNTEGEKPFFERTTISDFRLSEKGRDHLLAHLRDDGADFVNELDRWILAKEEILADPNGRRYGVSMFFFEDEEKQFPSVASDSRAALGAVA